MVATRAAAPSIICPATSTTSTTSISCSASTAASSVVVDSCRVFATASDPAANTSRASANHKSVVGI